MAHAIGVTGSAGLMVAVMAGGGSGGASFSSFEDLRTSKSVQQMVLASNQASSSAAPSTFLQIQSVATVCACVFFFLFHVLFFQLLLRPSS
jgi:uncharacterized protein involved in response to NO